MNLLTALVAGQRRLSAGRPSASADRSISRLSADQRRLSTVRSRRPTPSRDADGQSSIPDLRTI